MRKLAFYIISTVVILLSYAGCEKENKYPPHPVTDVSFADSVFRFADIQLRYAIECLDSVRADNSNWVTPLGVDHHTGNMVLGRFDSWRGGFFPGLMWMMYKYSNISFWKDRAEYQTRLIENVCQRSMHDLGFMFNNSFGKGYRITGQDEYKKVLLTASETLSQRYNPSVGCIRSWGNVDDSLSFVVIIDNMMNLELLFESTRITGDSAYYNMAVSHANKTMQNHFRANNSSYHVVNYNPNDGSVIKRYTQQGFSDESYWSRGQAWGLYGFTMCYRYTKEKKYLDQAEGIANFLMSLHYADDLIPYWDMLSPDIPNTVRDASAASIIASALIELSSYCGDSSRDLYLERAVAILKSLHRGYESGLGDNYGFLLLHSTQYYSADDMIDVPNVIADYYYLEAVMRLLNYKNLKDYLENS